MCTRMTMKTPGDELAQLFGAEFNADIAPRYNLAPTDPVPVIRVVQAAQDGPNVAEPSRTLTLLRWGLIPAWAKDPRIGTHLVNARSETVASKPAFRMAFRQRRCLVLADGFYEWRQLEGVKQPFHIRRVDGLPFALAGLWELWHGAQGTTIASCTVLTRASSGPIAELHDRMPAALDPGDLALWLTPEAPVSEVEGALTRADMIATDLFEHYAVDRYVSRVGHEGPRCVEPAEQGAKQGALF